jgi:hypothetical protein
MADKRITFAASQGWAVDNISHRPVVGEKVEVYSRQLLYRIAQIAGEAYGFKKYLRQYYG